MSSLGCPICSVFGNVPLSLKIRGDMHYRVVFVYLVLILITSRIQHIPNSFSSFFIFFWYHYLSSYAALSH